jgi:hypothetical protein
MRFPMNLDLSFRLFPHVSVAESFGMNATELRELMQVAEEKKELIERFWNEHLSF